jgi:LCP family protein required for cell wall assembly
MAHDKIHNALYFLAGAMAVILVLVIVVGVRVQAQSSQNSYQTDTSSSEAAEPEQQEKWQEGIVSYQGKNYRYNSDIRTYLMMGVDIDDPVETAEDYTKGGQSDAMFLLVTNSNEKTLRVISINRNAMADIEVCDSDGNSLGTLNAQICLQHAFGDGKKLSCINSVNAVAALFDYIPISGYLAMNMGGIPMMNDAVGGVTVTALDDVVFENEGVDIKEGETLTLDGTQAYYYLHGRDISEFNSATARLRREEQYIVAFMDRLKEVTAEDEGISAVSVYNAIDDYLVASVDFTGLINELMTYDFTDDDMYTVPGDTVLGEPINGESYEEYHVDEDLLEALIMMIFYEPVQ